jgi:hypothetical protein
MYIFRSLERHVSAKFRFAVVSYGHQNDALVQPKSRQMGSLAWD